VKRLRRKRGEEREKNRKWERMREIKITHMIHKTG
jgi:hypothetical protein